MPVSGPASSIPEVDAPRLIAHCLPAVSPQRSIQAGLATTSVPGRGKGKKKKHKKKQLAQSQKVLVTGEKNACIRKKKEKRSQSNNIKCLKKLKMKTKHNPKQAKTKAEINRSMHNK